MSNPYLGFRTYTEFDADRFVGRETEIRQLCEQIKRAQTTVLYANSGIGKSSLINAGLLPELRSEYLPICLRFAEIEDASSFDETIINWLCSPSLLSRLQSSEQFIVLGNRIEASSVNEGSLRFISTIDTASEDANTILKLVDEEYSKKSLWWFLRTRRLVQISPDGEEKELNPLFIFDQFEELFDKATSFDNSGSFFRWFNDLTSEFLPKGIQMRINELSYFLDSLGQHADTLVFDSMLNSKFLISMRRDYIGQLDYWTYQNEETRNTSLIYNRFYLRPLTEDQATTIITRRGEDSTLLRWKDQILSCTKETNDGYSTMLLSVICADIYDNGNVYEQIFEYQDEFESLGDYILSQIYEKALSASGIKKKQIRIIENDLVDEHGKRRRIYTDDNNYRLSQVKNIDQIIEALDGIVKCTEEYNIEKKRLLVELAHDRIADVVVKKRRIVKRHQTINTIKGYVALVVVGMAIMVSIGVWFPGFYYWRAAIKHGSYPSSSHDYTYGGSTFMYSELIIKKNGTRKDIFPYVVSVEINKKDSVYLQPFYNLQKVVIPQYIDSCSIYTLPAKEIVIDVNCKEFVVDQVSPNSHINIGRNVESFEIKSNTYTNLTIKVSEKNSTFIYENGILWNNNNHTIVYAQHDADTLIVFPPAFEQDSIIIWNNKRFHNYPLACTNTFEPVIVGDTLKKLTKMAKGKVDLTDKSFKVVGMKAFEGCAYIDTILLPSTVQEINAWAFLKCTSLKYINTQSLDSLNVIRVDAFSNCYNLDSLIIPYTCKNMHPSAVENCYSLKYVQYPYSMEWINLDIIENRTLLTIKLPTDCGKCSWKSSNKFTFIPDTSAASVFEISDGILLKWKDATKVDLDFCYIKNQFAEISEKNLKIFNDHRKHLFQDKDTVLFDQGLLLGIKNKEEWSYETLDDYSSDRIFKNSKSPVVFCYGSTSIGIYNCEKEKSIFLPEWVQGVSYFFHTIPDSLTELHIPNSNADRVVFSELPDYIKNRITLYVPWNCLDNYLGNKYLEGFKEIKEDPFLYRLLYVLQFYTFNISYFFKHNLWLLILLILVIIGVVFFGCLGIVTLGKKKKVPQAKMRRKVFFSSLKMIALATIGFIVFYWFGWIVLFDSIGDIPTYITSISLGIIGTFLLPWIWIFSEEFDKKKFKEVLKSSPAAMANWIRKITFGFVRSIKIIVKIIIKYKKIIVAIITLLASIQTFLNLCPNEELQHSISNWEAADKSTKDSTLLELVSIYPKSQSILCSHELSLKYDSIIAAVFDSLAFSYKVSYGDTLLRDDVGDIFDAENKLIYVSSDPIARYDIVANKIDTLSIRRLLPNDYLLNNYSGNCVNGNIYCLNETENDTIEILRLSDRQGSFEQTVIGSIPKDSIEYLGNTELRVSKDEKYVTVFSGLYDFIQLWNLEQKEKIFEREHIYPTSCQFGTDALFFYEAFGDSITEVSLTENVTAYTIFESNIRPDIVPIDDNQLLLKFYDEIGLLDIRTNNYSTLLKTRCSFCLMHEDCLYYCSNNSLLKYDLAGISNSNKAEKIKQYLEKTLHYEKDSKK